MSDSPIQWQDELLQMMFWMRGEGLGDEVTAEQLNRFLRLDRDQLASALARLTERKLVTVRGTSYRLTEEGVAEGQRRFADEFSPFVGHETHLQCPDPDCDCHSPGWDGICPSAAELL